MRTHSLDEALGPGTLSVCGCCKTRKVVSQIADDTRTPAEIIVKPQILRNLCWTDEPRKRDVAEFLKSQGARDWQVNLIAASVSRVIM